MLESKITPMPASPDDCVDASKKTILSQTKDIASQAEYLADLCRDILHGLDNGNKFDVPAENEPTSFVEFQDGIKDVLEDTRQMLLEIKEIIGV